MFGVMSNGFSDSAHFFRVGVGGKDSILDSAVVSSSTEEDRMEQVLLLN